MERFMCNIMATIVLAMSPATFSEDLKQPPLTLGELSALIRTSPPFEIRATRTYSTNVSAAELERRWQAVENKPDHPDRRELMRLRDLSRATESIELVMAFGGGIRYLAERRGDKMSLFAGGDESVRWMLGQSEFEPGVKSGQLTVIRAGVPFPMTSNVGQLLDETAQQVAVLCNWNIVANTLQVDASRSSGARESYSDGYSARFDVTQDSNGRMARVSYFANTDSVTPLWNAEIRYDINDPTLAIGLSLARSVRIVELSGVIEEWTNITAAPMAESTLRDLAKVPKVEAFIKIVDFGSSTAALPPQVPMLVWESQPDGDKFSVTPGTASAMPGLPVTSRSGWGLWMAVALMAGLAAVGFWRWRHRST